MTPAMMKILLMLFVVELLWTQAASEEDPSEENEITATVGDTTILPCKIGSLGNSSASWIRNRDLHILTVMEFTFSSDDRFTSLFQRQYGNYNLKIRYVQMRDAGVYSCRVHPDKGSIQNVTLRVIDGPVLTKTFNTTTLSPGSSITLICAARRTYFTPTTIEWTLDGRVQHGQEYINDLNELSSHFNIIDAKINDGGVYACTASYNGISVTHSARISVRGPPYVRSQTILVVEGEDTTVHCLYDGYPIDSIMWEKDGRVLPLNRRHKTYPNGTLFIEEIVQSSDQGIYTCIAREARGSTARGNVDVKVHERHVNTSEDHVSSIGNDLDLIHTFDTRVVSPGTTIILKCVASGSPTPIITWKLDGNQISNDERIQFHQHAKQNGETVSTLNITDAETNDGGVYSCIASSEWKSVTHYARINVYGSPYVRSSKVSVNEGDDMILHCPFAGYPIDSLVWQRNDRILPLNRRQYPMNNGTLLIQSTIKSSDEGRYTCIATNKDGSSARGHIDVRMIKKFPVAIHLGRSIDPYNIKEGDDIYFECEFSDADIQQVLWFHNKRQLHHQPSQGIIMSNQSLVIQKIDKDMIGSYTCKAIGQDIQGESKPSDVVIMYGPKPSIKIEDNINPQKIIEGEDVRLTCSADANPPPERYSWYLNNPYRYRKLEQDISRGIIIANMSLVLQGISKSSAGDYVCVAKNTVGEGYSFNFNIRVVSGPSIKEELQNQSVAINSDVILQCDVEGIPKPVVGWKRIEETGNYNSTSLDDPNVSINSDGILEISSIHKSQEGFYECYAHNEFGTTSAIVHVEVQASPNPPAIKLESATTGSITMEVMSTFRMDNIPILGLVFYYKAEFGNWKTVHVSPYPEDTYTIEDLACGTKYRIFASAYNNYGSSESSMVVNGDTKGNSIEVPIASEFLQVSSSSLTIYLDVWSNSGCPIENFEIEYKKRSEFDWILVSSNVKPSGNFVIFGLEPETLYNLRITANNNPVSRVTVYEFATSSPPS